MIHLTTSWLTKVSHNMLRVFNYDGFWATAAEDVRYHPSAVCEGHKYAYEASDCADDEEIRDQRSIFASSRAADYN